MNLVIQSGNAVKDPEIRTSSNGMTIADFSIAVSNFKQEGQADFFLVTAFSKTADIVGRFVKKGTKVYVVGSLHNETYQDKNGNNRTKTKIIADKIEFDNPNRNSGSQPTQHASQPIHNMTPVDDDSEQLPF